METVEVSLPLALVIKLVRYEERLGHIEGSRIERAELQELLGELVAHIQGDN